MERPMYPVDDLFAAYARGFEANRQAELTLPGYLDACRDNPMMYATATERLLTAIGDPKMIDTSKDARLGRIFMNRTIWVYPAFSKFYGMEETIEHIVRHAAQGLENRKQIMYLLGPVSGSKSSLAERLKAGDQLNPVFESPLGLFNPKQFVEMFKAPTKMLYPLLTAMREGNDIETENIGAIPFDGIILARSNEAAWQTFKNNHDNEAFIVGFLRHTAQGREERRQVNNLGWEQMHRI